LAKDPDAIRSSQTQSVEQLKTSSERPRDPQQDNAAKELVITFGRTENEQRRRSDVKI
jgi:hypothetical protein